MDITTQEIIDKYTPLSQAIRTHGQWEGEIDIIPIVISRTGSFHVRTLSEIAQLISPQEEPPDTVPYRLLPKRARKVALDLHVHAQNWLQCMLDAARQTLAPKRGHAPRPGPHRDNPRQ